MSQNSLFCTKITPVILSFVQCAQNFLPLPLFFLLYKQKKVWYTLYINKRKEKKKSITKKIKKLLTNSKSYVIINYKIKKGEVKKMKKT